MVPDLNFSPPNSEEDQNNPEEEETNQEEEETNQEEEIINTGTIPSLLCHKLLNKTCCILQSQCPEH
jgi:hypothetical protein